MHSDVRACSPRPRCDTLRGVTLIELLIVIALLLAIAVAVGPTIVSTLDERAFESAVDVSERQLLLARSHAQMSGNPVEVIYTQRDDLGIVQARLLQRGDEDAQTSLTQGWATRVLDDRLAITSSLPEQQVDASPTLASQDIQGSEQPLHLRLALFLPDGSSLAVAPRWLSDPDGRAARMDVNPYTGMATFTRLPPPEFRDVGDDAATDDDLEVSDVEMDLDMDPDL